MNSNKSDTTFEFLQHCERCPRDTTHCCTKKGNIILIQDEERKKLQELYHSFVESKDINSPVGKLDEQQKEFSLSVEYDLFEKKCDEFYKFKSIEESFTDENGNIIEIERCPFFKDPKCLLHDSNNKPIDCRLWPISKFQNGTEGNVYIDINCSAINSEKQIPKETVTESINLFNSFDDSKKSVYFNLSNQHYKLMPISFQLWDNFQSFIQEYHLVLNKTRKNINSVIERFSSNFITNDFNSSQVLKIAQWGIGLFLVLLIGTLIAQISGNIAIPKYIPDEDVLEKIVNTKELSTGSGSGFLILIFVVIFIVDLYRIIIPLPWIIKDYNKKKRIDDPLNNLPRYQVEKLITIGILSFLALNIMAHKFPMTPLYYLFFYGLIMTLDLAWYYFNRDKVNSLKDYFKATVIIILLLSLISVILLCFNVTGFGSYGIISFFTLLFLYFVFRKLKCSTKYFRLLYIGYYIKLKFSSNYEEEAKLVESLIAKEFERLTNKLNKIKLKYIAAGLNSATTDINTIAEYLNEQNNNLKTEKQNKLNELSAKFKESEKCEKEIDTLEKELADDKNYKKIAFWDIAFCLTPALLLLPYLLSVDWNCNIYNFIVEHKYDIISLFLVLHCIVAIVELVKNRYYIDYLKYLYMRDTNNKTNNSDKNVTNNVDS